MCKALVTQSKGAFVFMLATLKGREGFSEITHEEARYITELERDREQKLAAHVIGFVPLKKKSALSVCGLGKASSCE